MLSAMVSCVFFLGGGGHLNLGYHKSSTILEPPHLHLQMQRNTVHARVHDHVPDNLGHLEQTGVWTIVNNGMELIVLQSTQRTSHFIREQPLHHCHCMQPNRAPLQLCHPHTCSLSMTLPSKSGRAVCVSGMYVSSDNTLIAQLLTFS